jgi:tRNA modification GTPase
MDLIHARSERALAAASQQLHGALGRRLDELISPLLQVLARVEAYIDFPEEDLPAEDRARLQDDLATVTTGTRRLRATDRYGEILRSGIRTVILGEPNAGKSSLLNRLLGRDRAIVSPEPGTTRDYLEEGFVLGPHALRLIDTAGLNGAPGPIERRGMEKTLEQAGTAHLHLWVIDRSQPAPVLPGGLAGRLTPANTIAVLNKSDLPPAAGGFAPPFPTVAVSALRGDGLEELQAAIVAHADRLCPEFTEEVVAVNARHAQALDEAASSLASAATKLEQGSSPELLASDLRAALDAFGRIAGKIDNERMLDALFATFCIGK